MTIKGNLTQLLKPEQRTDGWILSEDEDFLYLNRNGKSEAIFNAHTSCLDKIDDYIKNQNIAENVQDFWKHIGKED
jgi:hypothetical protein